MAGLFMPDRLLDVLRPFTLFMKADGVTAKAACRYQQFRAVKSAAPSIGCAQARLARITRRSSGAGWSRAMPDYEPRKDWLARQDRTVESL